MFDWVLQSLQPFPVLQKSINPLSANPTKWSNTETIRRLLPTNRMSVFDHFMGLALNGLILKGKHGKEWVNKAFAHCLS